MIVYADSVSFARTLLGEAALDSVSVHAVEGADRELLRALLPGFPAGAIHSGRMEAPGIWRRLVLVREAECSQFDAVSELLGESGALTEGVLCIAGSGKGFHGQRGRPWKGELGNLHLTAYLSPRLPASRAGAAFSLLAAVAVLDAIDGIPGLEGRAGIKWVNDILIEGGKVAGFLTRTRCLGDEVSDLVLGIGINVEAAPRVESDHFVPAVACLRDLAEPAEACTLGAVWRGLSRALEGRYRALREAGPAPLLEVYRRRCLVLGRRVAIHEDTGTGDGSGEPVRGRVAGIGENLELLLEGEDRPVTRGRLALLD